MPSPDETRVEQLRGLFEGREAIYVEKGALRVRVSNIRPGFTLRAIFAEVEEIPTAGLPAAFFAPRDHWPHGYATGGALRWTIGGGYLTTFSDQTWQCGYGGWSLYFAPRLIESIVNLALQLPESLGQIERYNQVLDSLKNDEAYGRTQRLFAEP